MSNDSGCAATEQLKFHKRCADRRTYHGYAEAKVDERCLVSCRDVRSGQEGPEEHCMVMYTAPYAGETRAAKATARIRRVSVRVMSGTLETPENKAH